MARMSDYKNWFVEGAFPVPHEFPVDQTPQYTSAIKGYLSNLTGRSPSLVNEGMHECLKRFVGSQAKVHYDTGRYGPDLGSVLLLLADVERQHGLIQPSDWFRKIRFPPRASQSILCSKATKVQCREALTTLREFLQLLLKNKKDSATSNLLHAEFDIQTYVGGSRPYVALDFNIDCLSPEEGKASSLLERIQNVTWVTVPGETTMKYHELRKRFSVGDAPTLSISMTPISDGSRKYTRITFATYQH
jgi:hypothetical protein